MLRQLVCISCRKSSLRQSPRMQGESLKIASLTPFLLGRPVQESNARQASSGGVLTSQGRHLGSRFNLQGSHSVLKLRRNKYHDFQRSGIITIRRAAPHWVEHRRHAAVPQPKEAEKELRDITNRLENASSESSSTKSQRDRLEAQQLRRASADLHHESANIRGRSVYVPPQAPGPSNRDHFGRLPTWTSQNGNLISQQAATSRQIPEAISELTMLEGTVKSITLNNRVSGYLVAKIKVNPGDIPAERLQKGSLITAVANHKEMLIGQKLRLEGQWIRHKKYGSQLEVKNVIPYKMSETDEVLAKIRAAAIPGVGPATSLRLAKFFGARFEEVMDSADAVASLCEMKKMGAKTAAKMKKAWDSTRGQRDAAAFLYQIGLQGKVVQRVIARHGSRTKEEVTKDPYYAMRGIKGMNIRLADTAARSLEVEDFSQKPSRAAMAITDMLLEASRQRGHTYLLWDQLEKQTLQYLSASGDIWKGKGLSGIAQTAVTWGDIKVELGSPDFEFSIANAPSCSPAQIQTSLEMYLQQHLKNVGQHRAKQLCDQFGQGVFEVLERCDAIEQVEKCCTPVAAQDIKDAWTLSRGKRPAWHSPDPATKLLPLAERPHADKSQRFLVTVTPESWNGSVRCYHPEMHAAEISVSRELARLAAAPEINIPKRKVDQWITKNEAETKVKLSEGQRQAIRTAMTSPILILTGGPGCGKTYVTATIVKLWGAMHKNMKLAAPTGKASQRLQEVVELEASSTVHRLLQYKAAGSRADMDDEDALEGSYHFCRSNPLDADAVLVDEASMLDINLAAALLESLGPKTQLVLVGDVDQLPPVGPGTVLSAAIESKAIPVVDLREIFRQARESNIVKAAHSVQRGAFPALQEIPLTSLQDPITMDPSLLSGDAVWFRPPTRHDGSDIQDLLVTVMQKYVAARGYDLRTDVQVLSPMRRGTAGVEPLNLRLQALLNPPHMEVPEVNRFANTKQGPVFRHGDRVIQTINNYDREVFNGDSGFIVGVDPEERSLDVEYPETDYANIQQGLKTKIVEYKKSSFAELDMAWATTVHKAQGGESPVVVLVLSNGHGPLLARRLLYTALTRAKALVVVIGPESAIGKAVKEVDGDKRLSTVKDRIQAQAHRLNLPWRDMQTYGDAPKANPIDVTSSAPLQEAMMEGEKITTPGPYQSTNALAFTAPSASSPSTALGGPAKQLPVQPVSSSQISPPKSSISSQSSRTVQSIATKLRNRVAAPQQVTEPTSAVQSKPQKLTRKAVQKAQALNMQPQSQPQLAAASQASEAGSRPQRRKKSVDALQALRGAAMGHLAQEAVKPNIAAQVHKSSSLSKTPSETRRRQGFAAPAGSQGSVNDHLDSDGVEHQRALAGSPESLKLGLAENGRESTIAGASGKEAQSEALRTQQSAKPSLAEKSGQQGGHALNGKQAGRQFINSGRYPRLLQTRSGVQPRSTSEAQAEELPVSATTHSGNMDSGNRTSQSDAQRQTTKRITSHRDTAPSLSRERGNRSRQPGTRPSQRQERHGALYDGNGLRVHPQMTAADQFPSRSMTGSASEYNAESWEKDVESLKKATPSRVTWEESAIVKVGTPPKGEASWGHRQASHSDALERVYVHKSWCP